MEIRNIAIIAHVDHGKTTLTDGLLEHTGMIERGVSMDSNDLEKERGITIYAKNTSVSYKGTKINILDTPGHADFGSEVERVLRSVDSVYLIVDAAEGPMPQTKFVLKKSLELGLKPMVILNKIDKPGADTEKTEEAIYELFFDLGANDEQLDFPVVYAVGRDGKSTRDKDALENMEGLEPILDLILDHVPNVSTPEAVANAPRAQVFNLAYDNFLGRMGIIRVYDGSIKAGQEIFLKDHEGKTVKGKISKLFNFEGLSRIETTEVFAGDIAMIAGIPEVYIGQTILAEDAGELLPAITIDEPTISLSMFVNDSPFGGKVGKLLTSRQIRERLEKELEVNVGLKVDFSDQAQFKVFGRGELHIAVLIENMRREGFELQVSQPEVIFQEIDGVRQEPIENVMVNVPEELSGKIIELLSNRKGEMVNMVTENTITSLEFQVPTRGLLGLRSHFIILTKGEGIMYSSFSHYAPHMGEIQRRKVGSLISGENGETTGYSLWKLQERGPIFIDPVVKIYEGMIIGEHNQGSDLTVNATKGKQLTNVRSSGNDDAVNLTPPVPMTLERAIEYIKDDEYVEVTPENIRLRKNFLTENERKRK